MYTITYTFDNTQIKVSDKCIKSPTSLWIIRYGASIICHYFVFLSSSTELKFKSISMCVCQVLIWFGVLFRGPLPGLDNRPVAGGHGVPVAGPDSEQ